MSGRRYRGVWSMWPAVSAVLLHVALREVLKPWLNGSSDAKFWGAVALLLLPLIFAVVALIRSIRPPPP